MIITKYDAQEIAKDSMKYAGYGINHHGGYYTVFSDGDFETVIAVNKDNEDGHKYFSIYIENAIGDETKEVAFGCREIAWTQTRNRQKNLIKRNSKKRYMRLHKKQRKNIFQTNKKEREESWTRLQGR